MTIEFVEKMHYKEDELTGRNLVWVGGSNHTIAIYGEQGKETGPAYFFGCLKPGSNNGDQLYEHLFTRTHIKYSKLNGMK